MDRHWSSAVCLACDVDVNWASPTLRYALIENPVIRHPWKSPRLYVLSHPQDSNDPSFTSVREASSQQDNQRLWDKQGKKKIKQGKRDKRQDRRDDQQTTLNFVHIHLLPGVFDVDSPLS